MRKRMIPLFLLILLAAPAAMATHCERCVPDFEFGGSYCERAFHVPGFTSCDDVTEPGTCSVSGVVCSPHGFAPAADFASEFAVVSVERLD